MSRILMLAPALLAVLACATGAAAQDGGGVGVTSGPQNVNPIPPSFFGPFHTNMPMAMGPGPADNMPILSGGPSGGGVSAPGAPGAGSVARRWGFAAGGVGQAPQPATVQPAATGQPGAMATRPGPSVMFRRFGR